MTTATAHVQNILVPCDFSGYMNEVIKFSVDLAKRYQAKLTLLHVYEMPIYAIPPDSVLMVAPDVLSQQLSEMMQLLEQTKTDLEAQGVHNVVTKLAQGAAAVEILKECDENHYDLIVMGTHGRTGIKHVLIGSVAEKIVRKAPCPVLTIRNGAAHLDEE